jgi:hypothetical protein
MIRSRRALAACLVAVSVTCGLSALEVEGLPRYAARYEQNCSLCHVNPTGGGMRTAYATQQLVPKELAWSPGSPASLAEIEPFIGKHIGIGVDFREVYLAESPGSPEPVPQGFFLMQANTYLSFQLDSAATLYFSRGQSNTYEVFGMDYVRPWCYVKAGRFTPAFGWKYDDHTMFVRSELGFFPPAHTDVGLELGFLPKRFDVQIDVVNGNRGSIQDNDRELAESVNAIGRFHFGPAGVALGVSGYHQPGRTLDLDVGGGHGALTLGPLTWVGQADLVRRAPEGASATHGIVTSHELTLELHQGLELIGTYDFFDPDIDLQSGAKSRGGGGVHLLARSFLALEGLYRRTHYEPGPALPGGDFDEGVLQIHALY